jgi:hypothetical protein
MKPGYKTTEFYIIILTDVALFFSAVGEVLPPKYASMAAAVVSGAYADARGLAKITIP